MERQNLPTSHTNLETNSLKAIKDQTTKALEKLIKKNKPSSQKRIDTIQNTIESIFVESKIEIAGLSKTFEEHKKTIINSLGDPGFLTLLARLYNVFATANSLTHLTFGTIGINIVDKQAEWKKTIEKLLKSEEKSGKEFAAYVCYCFKKDGEFSHYINTREPKASKNITTTGVDTVGANRLNTNFLRLPDEGVISRIINGSAFNRDYLRRSKEAILENTLKYIQITSLEQKDIEKIKLFYQEILELSPKSSNIHAKQPSVTAKPSSTKVSAKKSAPYTYVTLYTDSSTEEPEVDSAKEAERLIDFYYQKQATKPQSQQDKQILSPRIANNTTNSSQFINEAEFLGFGKIIGLNPMQADFVSQIATSNEDNKISFARLGSDTGSGKSAIVSERVFPLQITPAISPATGSDSSRSSNPKFTDKNLNKFVQSLFTVIGNIKAQDGNRNNQITGLKKIIQLGTAANDNRFYRQLINADSYNDLLQILINDSDILEEETKVSSEIAQGQLAIHIQPNLFSNYLNNYQVISINAQNYLQSDEKISFDINKLILDINKKLPKSQGDNSGRKISLSIDEAHLLSKKGKLELEKVLQKAKISGNVIFVSATLPANAIYKEDAEVKDKNTKREELLKRLANSFERHSLSANAIATLASKATEASSSQSRLKPAFTFSQQTTSGSKASTATSKTSYQDRSGTSSLTISQASSPTASLLLPAATSGTIFYNGALQDKNFSITASESKEGSQGNVSIKATCTISSAIQSSIKAYQTLKVAGEDVGDFFVFPVSPSIDKEANKPDKFIVINSQGDIVEKSSRANNEVTIAEKDLYFSTEDLSSCLGGRKFVYFCPTAEGHNPPFAVIDKAPNPYPNPYNEVIALLPQNYLKSTNPTELNSLLYQIRGRARQTDPSLRVFEKQNDIRCQDKTSEADKIAEAELKYREEVGSVLKDNKLNTQEISQEEKRYLKTYLQRVYDEFQAICSDRYSRYKCCQSVLGESENSLQQKFLLANIYLNAKGGASQVVKEAGKIFDRDEATKQQDIKWQRLFLNSNAHYLAGKNLDLKGNQPPIALEYLNSLDKILRIKFLEKFAEKVKEEGSILGCVESSQIEFNIKDGELYLSFAGFEVVSKELIGGEELRQVESSNSSISQAFESVAKALFLPTNKSIKETLEKSTEESNEILNKALEKLKIEIGLDAPTAQRCQDSSNISAFSMSLSDLQTPVRIGQAFRGACDNFARGIANIGNAISGKDQEIEQLRQEKGELKQRNEELEQRNKELRQRNEGLEGTCAEEDDTFSVDGGGSLSKNIAVLNSMDRQAIKTTELEAEIAKLKEKDAMKDKEIREHKICRELDIPDGLTFAQIGNFMLVNWKAVYGEEFQKQKQEFQETVQAIEEHIKEGANEEGLVEKMKQEIEWFCEKFIRNEPTITKNIFTEIKPKSFSFDENGIRRPTINNLICTVQKQPSTIIKDLRVQQISTQKKEASYNVIS